MRNYAAPPSHCHKCSILILPQSLYVCTNNSINKILLSHQSVVILPQAGLAVPQTATPVEVLSLPTSVGELGAEQVQAEVVTDSQQEDGTEIQRPTGKQYLGEIETEFENTIAFLSGAQMGSNHENNGGRKSRDTLPLTHSQATRICTVHRVIQKTILYVHCTIPTTLKRTKEA